MSSATAMQCASNLAGNLRLSLAKQPEHSFLRVEDINVITRICLQFRHPPVAIAYSFEIPRYDYWHQLEFEMFGHDCVVAIRQNLQQVGLTSVVVAILVVEVVFVITDSVVMDVDVVVIEVVVK